MLTGVALAQSELPLHLVEERLSGRVVERGGEREVQFLFADPERLLPVWLNGRLELACWGVRRALPITKWGTAASRWAVRRGESGGEAADASKSISTRDPRGVYSSAESALGNSRSFSTSALAPAL